LTFLHRCTVHGVDIVSVCYLDYDASVSFVIVPMFRGVFSAQVLVDAVAGCGSIAWGWHGLFYLCE